MLKSSIATRKFRSRVLSFIKNMKKGKYYSIFRGIWDLEYRRQINRMLDLTCEKELVLCHGAVPFGYIIPGHKVNYPKWVDHLTKQIHSRGWKSLEPIKVIWDPFLAKWRVVDGNHRYYALNKSLPPYIKIPVLILRPKDEVLREQSGLYDLA